MIEEFITERYSKETGNSGLGCANLQPFLSIRKGDVILDLGCGNGDSTAKLCEITGENGFIYGLDITTGMIEKARERNNKPNLGFILADIHDIPLENESVNIVLSNCVINHSTDKRKVFKEIHRILKSGGHFLIGDVMSAEKLPEEISSDPQKIAECWGGAIRKQEYTGIISGIGFINIKELSSRQYYKNNFLLESVILKGEKK
jgi:arsenite methyltransferase